MKRPIFTLMLAGTLVLGTSATGALAFNGVGPVTGAAKAAAAADPCGAILGNPAFPNRTPNANQIAVFTLAGCSLPQ